MRSFSTVVAAAIISSSTLHYASQENESGYQLPRLFHILPQLLHQQFDTREWLGVTQSFDELHRQFLPVQVAVEADQVDFHLVCLFAEGWIRPNISGAGPL